jgi:hypothetical protein
MQAAFNDRYGALAEMRRARFILVCAGIAVFGSGVVMGVMVALWR